ncbi:hypothetical protein [Kingella oralis]|uniref:hypothetical protein n=1 Tax=Kingella oralis TaxID=505 RepID=UPI0034E443AB
MPRHWVARCAKVSGCLIALRQRQPEKPFGILSNVFCPMDWLSGCRKHPAQGSLKQYNPALASRFQAA